MRVARAVGIVAAALFCQCTALQAECITPPPPCEALKQASVVALVDVVEGHRQVELPTRPGVYSVRTDARLRVLERFKGIPPDQTELAIRIPFSAESAWLSAGRTYLVYAFVDTNGDWGTGCTRTKVADADDDEVRTLRQCK